MGLILAREVGQSVVVGDQLVVTNIGWDDDTGYAMWEVFKADVGNIGTLLGPEGSCLVVGDIRIAVDVEKVGKAPRIDITAPKNIKILRGEIIDGDSDFD